MTADQVIAIVEQESGKGPLSLSTQFTSLKIDSLEFVEIMLRVQGDSGVTIPDAAWTNIHTIGDIVSWLETNQAVQ